MTKIMPALLDNQEVLADLACKQRSASTEFKKYACNRNTCRSPPLLYLSNPD